MYFAARPLTLRINTLKTDRKTALRLLDERQVPWRPVPWCPDAVEVEESYGESFRRDPLLEEGVFYVQSLSSMIPALILDPRPDAQVLDLCAAPGSKTSQMAALMENTGSILAVDSVRSRVYKLRSNLSRLGVRNVRIRHCDARRLPAPEVLFDKVLVDAPCSSEGRFRSGEPKTFAYWSLRKIREMQRKQKGLLLAAGRLLKRDGCLVYSTCTFAPEENEASVDWLLRKTAGALRLEPVRLEGLRSYTPLQEWNGKRFDPQVRHCLRVRPDALMEGFFVAKFIKR